MKQIGKIGKRNLECNQKLKKTYLQKGITSCELSLTGCLRNNFLSFAHKHKRVWYYDKPELLSDFNETLLACIPCHQKVEYDRKLSEEMFQQLRK